MTKRRKTHDEGGRREQLDEEFIPLPIQTFLWRQTSPFVRPFLGKARDLAQIEQRDACKLFERIIITNNIWGQSPSLTDAISSIDRWRLIKVSFPFVLQCTASLLNNKLIKDHTFNRLAGNEAKMMYTLQWILMNASEECADSENEAKSKAKNAAIAAATAYSLLKPTDAFTSSTTSMGAAAAGHTIVSLGSNSSNSTGLEIHQRPNGANQVAASASSTQTNGQQSQLQSRVSGSAPKSIAIPAASAAIDTVAAVAAPAVAMSSAATFQVQTTLASTSSSVSPIGSSTPTKSASPTNLATASSCPSNYLLPISSIQMFAYYFAPMMDGLKHSDFLSSNQRLEIGAALWEPLFNHQLPNISCLTARVKPRRQEESGARFKFDPLDRSFLMASRATRLEQRALAVAQTSQATDQMAAAATYIEDRRRSSSMVTDQAQFGDVFLGGPNLGASQRLAAGQEANKLNKRSDSNQQTSPQDQPSGPFGGSSVGQHPHEGIKCPYATYFDVAILRCLFINDWQESGVFWSLSYLANRLSDFNYPDEKELQLRPKLVKSKSLDSFEPPQVSERDAIDEDSNNRQARHSKKKHERKLDHQSSTSSRFLRVEDADNSDSGCETKNPVRRLSFSSGVQTLANQIRKTSKRVKKSNEGYNSGSQLSINQISSAEKSLGQLNQRRRSSSADELSSSQISALSTVQRESTSSSKQNDQREDSKSKHNKQTDSYPVITVTTNLASRDIKPSYDQHLTRRLYAKSLKYMDKLTRSQSVPKDLHFSPFEMQPEQSESSESIGAAMYVDDAGRIDPIVVLKVIHSISRRESACSLRVCDRLLCIVTKLMSIGVLKQNFNFLRKSSQQKNLTNLLASSSTCQHEFTLITGKSQILRLQSEKENSLNQRIKEAGARARLIHEILVDTIFRLYNHLGCPNNCGMESTVEHHNMQNGQAKLSCFSARSNPHNNEQQVLAKTLSLNLRVTLDSLCQLNKNNFIKYIQAVFADRPLQQVVDVLHTILGFCRSDASKSSQTPKETSGQTVQFANSNENAAKSLGSISSTHSDQSLAPEKRQTQQASPSTRETNKDSVDTIIVSNSFRQLISRMAKISKELKLQENAYLYCDIRRLIHFTRENYNNVFRSIVLSALIDCTKLINSQQKKLEFTQGASRRELTRQPSEDDPSALGAKLKSKSSGQDYDSTIETEAGESPSQASKHHDSQQRSSIGSYKYSAQQRQARGSKPISPLKELNHQNEIQSSSGILSLSKAKKKLEQVFGGKTNTKVKLNAPQSVEELAAQSAVSSSPALDADRNSTLSRDELNSRPFAKTQHQVATSQQAKWSPIAHNQLGSSFHHETLSEDADQQVYAAVQSGMQNFSFLMESCLPGDFLDPALLAALLDLKSPVAIRAAIFLECANFVHRCNRGQWPLWMKMNSPATHRGSNAGISQSSGAIGHQKSRKSSSIQRSARNTTLMYRAAGRAFYSWAEAVGARLEELLQFDTEFARQNTSCSEDRCTVDSTPDMSQSASDDYTGLATGSISRSIILDISRLSPDTQVDFFQPTIDGDSSPFALKMAACHLLFEVTTFLRETYRYLPPTIVQHQMATSKLGDKMSSIYDVSRAVTANRRWSMALSSLGFGQLPATLSAVAAAAAAQSNNHLKNPTTGAISEHPERRISFILHETNDEDEQQNDTKSHGDSASMANSQGQVSGELTSPLAPSVNTNEQQQEAMRKLTAGRHLSQSSASSAVVVAAATCLLRSSGVIESQSHRRKSIKLKKTSQEKEAQRDKKTKFAQDLDEEQENSSISDIGVRRTDSIRSRRRVSGISEKSDTSDRTNNQHEMSNHQVDGQPQGANNAAQADLSGDDSVGGSCEENYAAESSDRYEDESKIMSNMPWFKAIAMINSSIDCNCSHYPHCEPFCYKLHQSMCRRLISSVQSIYEAPLSETGALFESRLEKLLCDKQSEKCGSSIVRAGSDCSTNDTPGETKRRDKRSKKHQVDSSIADDKSNLMSKSSRDTPQGERGSQPSGNQHLNSISSANGLSSLANHQDAIKLLAASARNAKTNQEEPPIVKYMKSSVKSLLHCPMSSFLKGAVILPRENFTDMIRFSWNLLLEDDQQISRTAAVGFIISSIKCPGEASKLLLEELASDDASRKIAAINKFYVVWDARYQCWPRLEDGAFVHFKMAPPSIEFTLPSPKIAQESRPVVDPPWMPRKTSNVEEVTIGQEQTVQKSFVTATKTRRKQQIEIVTKALREKHDKLREDRENYQITSVPITLYAAYEPTLGAQAGGGATGDEMDGATGGGATDDDTQQENRALLQMKTAQALFPTCLCQAAIVMINLLDDSRVTYEGCAVYEVATKVIWSCLVDDPSLFLRYFFERLTRQNQNTIFQVLRRLIRFMPRLPPQAAYTLYNYLIGFIIYYIRCPIESSQKLISDTLSVLCLVVPSVYGLFLKDLKQILRKEQCDHNLLITANVPSAKKIIVHGSDSSGIPSQFPIDESTQFYHILVDSLEFFGIEKPKQNEYFLIDVRTNHMHNLHSYVRDYYSFKRSQHPQLQLINMNPNKAFDLLQKQELINLFLESGKVSMSLAIVKSSHMAFQRVLFLHEELMKLPTFPRKTLETNFTLFRGPLGHQVFSMDRVQKICWVRVIARMFELTSGFFLQLGDIQLFLNAICGIFVLHCEEASVSRFCLATFINATHQFKNIFATDGFMSIMGTIVQVYSSHQNNHLLCRSIEFVCKQFYIMHRKPFLLQLFGSVASRLNTAEMLQQNQTGSPLSANQLLATNSGFSNSGQTPGFILNDPSRISPSAFFRLLQSLEKAFKDPLDILELVDAEKPLRAVDFCYQQDKEAIEMLDIISLCVTVTAYASDSPRSTQMLIILETVVPLYMRHLQASTSKKAGQSMGKQAHKDELQKIQSISICIRTLIVNCDGLTRNFNGPLPSIDFRSSSIRRPTSSARDNKSSVGQSRNQNPSGGSPMDIYRDEHSISGTDRPKKEQSGVGGTKQATIVPGLHRGGKTNLTSDESELTRGEFLVPRDTLLNLVAEFLSLSTGRLVESAKKYVDLHQKHSSYELLDVKSHLRLAEVANSLLKFASTDPSVMACRGLIRYMNEILPNTEWRQEAIRPALILILKRLDKTFNRIAKKSWVKRTTDWEGAKQLLRGAYLTFIKHPYIVHLPHLKSLISCCQNIILSEGPLSSQSNTSTLFHGLTTSNLTNSNQTMALGLQTPSVSGTARHLASGSNLLSVGAGGSGHSLSNISPNSPALGSGQQATLGQQSGGSSLVAVTAAAALAERLAANAAASSNSVTSQGFNSVTIRLIAMQLLQTGENQTLENLVGNYMNTPEKLESLMLNLIYPMCIRVCSGAREAPKLRLCDIMFILNLVLNMLAPNSASSKSFSSTANSPKATSDTSQFILSKITTTISGTQTGASALGIVGSTSHLTTNTHNLVQPQENFKIGFLGLKILCICFESQLASEWIRIARVIRDLALQPGQPSGSLWDFLDFVATYRFPIFILLLPTIKCQLAKKVKEEQSNENMSHYMQCKRLIDAKIHGSAATVCRSKSFLFVSLTAELRMLKEQLAVKRRQALEGERRTSSHGANQNSSSSGQQGVSWTGQTGDGSSQQGDHFNAYYRLSAAIASFANQGGQAKGMTHSNSNSNNQQSAIATSAALKGACFAAQLGTSTPLGDLTTCGQAVSPPATSRYEPSQSSIRLSTAKSREEARKVMNTILRRTSYPHNQALLPPERQPSGNERKNSQPPQGSSGTETGANSMAVDIESGKSETNNQQ